MNLSREAALFALELTKPATERAAGLDRECGDDKALHIRLGSLLATHDQPETVLESESSRRADPRFNAPRRDELRESPSGRKGAAKVQGLTELGPPEDEAVGQTPGRCKLLERVGEGVCGVL